MVFKVPTVLQAGPSATTMSYNDHPYATSASDFFKVGTVGVNKTINVVAPSNGAATITVPGGENVTLSQQNDIRVLVKRTQAIQTFPLRKSTELAEERLYPAIPQQ